LRVRFPDSEIRGSEGARPYSRLIAACYVLHRLCAPRHPPDALALTLDRSAFVPCPEKRPSSRTIRRLSACAVPFLEWYLCDQIECLMDQPVVRPANPAFTCQRFRIRTDVRIQIVFLSKSKPRSTRIVGALDCGGACGLPPEAAEQRRMVEPIGIEPTTSSLQSSRSPN
jgi:hypothetical protein